jgi:hypothetical protein
MPDPRPCDHAVVPRTRPVTPEDAPVLAEPHGILDDDGAVAEVGDTARDDGPRVVAD